MINRNDKLANQPYNINILKATIHWLYEQVKHTEKALKITQRQNNTRGTNFNLKRMNELANRILHTDHEMVEHGLICA
jgi:hypothetical protein